MKSEGKRNLLEEIKKLRLQAEQEADQKADRIIEKIYSCMRDNKKFLPRAYAVDLQPDGYDLKCTLVDGVDNEKITFKIPVAYEEFNDINIWESLQYKIPNSELDQEKKLLTFYLE